MKFWVAVIIVVVALCISCASTGKSVMTASKKDNSSSPLSITGTVVYADGQAVQGAIVTTEPLSEQTLTDANGAFEISKSLAPGIFTVKAEMNGNRGSVKMGLQYGAIEPIKIKLGENIEISTVSGDSIRVTVPASGESRTKVPR